MALGLTQTLTQMSKGKAVPSQARRVPEGSRKLRFPDFATTAQDGGYSWYSFLLEAELTPASECDRKDVNEKFQSHQVRSNQRPSDL